jgi:hypothetical protein
MSIGALKARSRQKCRLLGEFCCKTRLVFTFAMPASIGSGRIFPFSADADAGLVFFGM